MTYTDDSPIVSGSTGFAAYRNAGRFEVGNINYVSSELKDITPGRINDGLASFSLHDDSASVEMMVRYGLLYTDGGTIVNYPSYMDGVYYLKKSRDTAADVKITKDGYLYALTANSAVLTALGFEDDGREQISDTLSNQSEPFKVVKKICYQRRNIYFQRG